MFKINYVKVEYDFVNLVMCGYIQCFVWDDL